MNQQHIVKRFDAELQRLTAEIADMGDGALSQVTCALQALESRNEQLAQQVIDGDDAIDQREREISHEVLRLLALRQPNARDLREVLAALRIASDIERIADHAVSIARLSLAMKAPVCRLPDGVRHLGELTCGITREVLLAWRTQDARLAHEAWRHDDEVDRVHAALVRSTLDEIRANPGNAEACTQRLFIAKNLERIGDHATNIAENVWFMMEGDGMP